MKEFRGGKKKPKSTFRSLQRCTNNPKCNRLTIHRLKLMSTVTKPQIKKKILLQELNKSHDPYLEMLSPRIYPELEGISFPDKQEKNDPKKVTVSPPPELLAQRRFGKSKSWGKKKGHEKEKAFVRFADERRVSIGTQTAAARFRIITKHSAASDGFNEEVQEFILDRLCFALQERGRETPSENVQ